MRDQHEKISGKRKTGNCDLQWMWKETGGRAGILREGGFSVNYPWDYFSEKDGEVHHWDLCEACYDRLIRQFRIAPEIEEAVEFI